MTTLSPAKPKTLFTTYKILFEPPCKGMRSSKSRTCIYLIFCSWNKAQRKKRGFLIQCKFIILCVKIVLFINWIGKLKLVFSHNFELFKFGQNSCIISIQHWQIQFRSLLKWKNRTKEMIETVQLLCRDTISVFVQF